VAASTAQVDSASLAYSSADVRSGAEYTLVSGGSAAGDSALR
jgi:hypothetical protein